MFKNLQNKLDQIKEFHQLCKEVRSQKRENYRLQQEMESAEYDIYKYICVEEKWAPVEIKFFGNSYPCVFEQLKSTWSELAENYLHDTKTYFCPRYSKEQSCQNTCKYNLANKKYFDAKATFD